MKPRTRIRDIVEKVRATDGWHLADGPHPVIRRHAMRGDCDCPITVGTRWRPNQFLLCAADCGLPKGRAYVIVGAADECWRDIRAASIDSRRQRRIDVVRRALLEAAGLSEAS